MSNIDYKIVIPARYNSSRFPGKPLALIQGKPMLWHVYQRAVETGVKDIVIATDNEQIEQVALSFGGDVCMTSESCESGTDRIAEVCIERQWLDDTIIVNLQGDEPLTPPKLLVQVANNLSNNPDAAIATLCTKISSFEDFQNPNIVKVVKGRSGMAHYFSRAPIPWPRDNVQHVPDDACRHLGLYAYRAEFLKAWPGIAASSLEQTEKLEQLRAMDAGFAIHLDHALTAVPHGVDTPDQLAALEVIMKSSNH